jgi:hypothetical protein
MPLVTGTTTDDRGEYSLSVTPGEYAVGALTTPFLASAVPAGAFRPPPGLASGTTADALTALARTSAGSGPRGIPAQPPPATEPAARTWVWAGVFFPDSASPAQAERIALRAGNAREGVDLMVRLAAAATVSGTVMSPGGLPVPVQGLRLFPAGSGTDADVGFDVASTNTNSAGGFVFLNVPPGTYVIKAIRVVPPENDAAPIEPVAQWGQATVVVDGVDVAGTMVMLQGGGTIRGHVVVDARGSRPSERPSFGDMRVIVEPAAWPQPATRPQPVTTALSAAGEFVVGPLLPGTYVVRMATPSGWYLAGITGSGVTTAARPLDVIDDVALALVVSDRLGWVRGTLAGTGPQTPLDDISIVVFPTDELSWPVAEWDDMHVRRVAVSVVGDYQIALPPGDYYVAALSDQSLGAWWREPSSLSRLARVSERITIRVDETRMISAPVRSGP